MDSTIPDSTRRLNADLSMMRELLALAAEVYARHFDRPPSPWTLQAGDMFLDEAQTALIAAWQ